MGSLTDDRCSSASILHQGVGFVTLLASHIMLILSVSHEKTKTADSAYEQQRRPAGRGQSLPARARALLQFTIKIQMTSE